MTETNTAETKDKLHVKTIKKFPIYVHLFRTKGEKGRFTTMSITRQYKNGSGEVKFSKGDMNAQDHLEKLQEALVEAKQEIEKMNW